MSERCATNEDDTTSRENTQKTQFCTFTKIILYVSARDKQYKSEYLFAVIDLGIPRKTEK